MPSGRRLFESLLIFENILHGIGWAGRDGVNVRHERNLGWTNYPLTIGVMAEGELTSRRSTTSRTSTGTPSTV